MPIILFADPNQYGILLFDSFGKNHTEDSLWRAENIRAAGG